jgi:hypothetical protein
MRSDAVFNFDNTFDVYQAVNSQDPVTGQIVSTYEFTKSDKGLIIPGQGSQVYLSARTNYAVGSQVRAVKDRNGTPLFSNADQEYPMYILAAAPQYDCFGSVIGWRHTLATKLPRDVVKEMETFLSA